MYKALVDKHQPKVIICTGKTFEGDFLQAFTGNSDTPMIKVPLKADLERPSSPKKGKHFNCCAINERILVITTYFLGTRYGFNTDVSLVELAEEINKVRDNLVTNDQS